MSYSTSIPSGLQQPQTAQMQEIEISLNIAKEAVLKADALKSLQKSKEYELVFQKGYFVDEASRLVLLKADPNMQKPEQQAQLANMTIAIGYLHQYLSAVARMGEMAEGSIAEYEQTREDIRSGVYDEVEG